MRDLIVPAALGLDLSQYFGLWAVEESRFLAAYERAAGMDLAAHVQAARGRDLAGDAIYEVRGGVAILEIQGTMTKQGSSLSGAGSTVMLRKAVRNAARDEEVSAVVFRIDSPGGTVAGTSDLADEVAALSALKPTVAFCEDMTASAAYWVASQCREIVANSRTAMVGSIGTFVGLYDLSGMAAMEGIRPVVVKAGAFKADGFPGTAITADAIARWQSLVDKTQAAFTGAVAKGRRLDPETAAALADGRVHMAEDAIALKLADRIESFESVVARLGSSSGRPKATKGAKPMADESKDTAPVAAAETNKLLGGMAAAVQLGPRSATPGELKAACPGAEPAWLFGQAERGATVEQAKDAWMTELNSRLAAANTATEQANARQAMPGADPVRPTSAKAKAGEGTSFDGLTWADAVAAELKAGARDRMTACSRANAKYPGLREQAVVDHNRTHRPKVKVELD